MIKSEKQRSKPRAKLMSQKQMMSRWLRVDAADFDTAGSGGGCDAGCDREPRCHEHTEKCHVLVARITLWQSNMAR